MLQSDQPNGLGARLFASLRTARRRAETPAPKAAPTPDPEPPAPAKPLTDPEARILALMRSRGGVALLNQPAGQSPRIRIGDTILTDAPTEPIADLIAALHTLARKRFITPAGSSPFAEVFRLVPAQPVR